MNLSPHFTLEEMLQSETAERKGIDNTPTPEVIANLKLLCANVLEPLREAFKTENPATLVCINSGFRCVELNKEIGGVQNPPSQHTLGMAADIHIKGVSHEAVFNWIKNNTPYDQVIREFPPGGWVHVSYNNVWGRKNAFVAVRKEGKTVYLPQLLDLA